MPFITFLYQFAINEYPTVNLTLIPVISTEKFKIDAPQTLTVAPSSEKPVAIVCLGGTFDRLHCGHKILLTTAAILCTESLIIGINSNIARKQHSAIIEPLSYRAARVVEFVLQINSGIFVSVKSIDDVAGPAATVPRIDLLVLSEETKKGGEIVNQMRVEGGLPPARWAVIGTITLPSGQALSSTHLRTLAEGSVNKP
jgi:cytidyltransferase-like protein